MGTQGSGLWSSSPLNKAKQGEKIKSWVMGSCSHQRPIPQSQLFPAYHCPPPFSVSLSFAFSLHREHLTSLCPSSIFHLDFPNSYLCLHPPSSPLPWSGTGNLDERRTKPEPKSIPHLFPTLSHPSFIYSPLLLSCPWLAIACIGALLCALRWRAHTVGLLHLH